MSKRLIDVRNELEEQELLAKIAQVTSAWGENELALELLSEAVVELEKQAAEGAFGPAGLSGSQLITMGVSYAAEAMEEIEKQAEEAEEMFEVEETEDVYSDEFQEKLASDYSLGHELGAILGASGLTTEDLDKLASDEASEEEIEQFSQLLAHLSVENALEGQE